MAAGEFFHLGGLAPVGQHRVVGPADPGKFERSRRPVDDDHLGRGLSKEELVRAAARTPGRCRNDQQDDADGNRCVPANVMMALLVGGVAGEERGQ